MQEQEHIIRLDERKTPAEFVVQYGAVIALLLMIVFNMIFTQNFMSINTLFLLIRQTTNMMFMTVGMTLVISAGGIDISSGSMMALAGILVAKWLVRTDGKAFFFWALLALVVCGLIGAFNGYLIAKIKVQPIILTLVMQIMIRGIVLLYSESLTIFLDKYPIVDFLGLYQIGGAVPIQIVYLLILLVTSIFFVKKTMLGKNIEAVGENPAAARLAGIKTNKIIITVYVLSCVLAGLCGILEMCRAGVMDPNDLGNLKEFDAIAAVAIGGTAMRGGKMNMIGSLAGCIIMILINATVNMNGVPAAISNLVKAAIIILALAIQRERKA